MLCEVPGGGILRRTESQGWGEVFCRAWALYVVNVQVLVMNLFHLLQLLIKVMCSEATGVMGKALEETRDGKVIGACQEPAISVFLIDKIVDAEWSWNSCVNRTEG